jgi:MFS family permease
MGFFAGAYDLFVIGVAATLIKQEWQLSASRLALLNAVMLAAAVVGAGALGRVADLVGWKRVSSGEQLPEVPSEAQLPEVAALSQLAAGDPPLSWLVLLGSSAARRPVPPDRAA